MSQASKQQTESKPKFQPKDSDLSYTEGGKFGRQEGQPGSKGPDISPGAKQVIQHPQNKQQAKGGVPEHHPKDS